MRVNRPGGAGDAVAAEGRQEALLFGGAAGQKWEGAGGDSRARPATEG